MKIDSNLDPLGGIYSAPIKPTRSSSRSQGKYRNSKKARSSSGVSPQSSVFSVPSGDDGESSDSESVGPMLDDEQVLALTLEFEDKASTEDVSPPGHIN